ncbi:MAG: hypothetical protein AAF447_04875 [Myxococcota bacterium]
MTRYAPLCVLALGCTQLVDADVGGAARREAARAVDDRVAIRGATRRPEYGPLRSTEPPFVDALEWASPFVAGQSVTLRVALPEGATLLWELEDAARRYALPPGDGVFTVDVAAEGEPFDGSRRTVCLAAEDASGLIGAPLCLPLFASETVPPGGLVRPRVVRMHPAAERAEAVAAGDNRTVTGSSGGQLTLLEGALPTRRIAAHAGPVWDLEADERGFVSAGGDAVRSWSGAGELLGERVHPDVRAVTRRGTRLCSAGRDRTLRCGDDPRTDDQRTLDDRINVMDADAEGTLLALGLGRFALPGALVLVDAETLELRATAPTGDSVTAVAFGEGRIAAAWGSGQVALYDLGLEEQRRFEALGGPVDGLAFRDGTLVALTLDGDVAVWALARPDPAPALRVALGVAGYALDIEGDQALLGMSAGALWTFTLPAVP